MVVILAVENLKQEDHEFMVILGYTENLSQNKTKTEAGCGVIHL